MGEHGASPPLCSPILLILPHVMGYSLHWAPPYIWKYAPHSTWVNSPHHLVGPSCAIVCRVVSSCWEINSPNKATSLKMEIFWPPPYRATLPSDLFLIFTVFQILDSKFPFFKQLWGHWKTCIFTREQNHPSNKCNKLLLLIKMKCK